MRRVFAVLPRPDRDAAQLRALHFDEITRPKLLLEKHRARDRDLCRITVFHDALNGLHAYSPPRSARRFVRDRRCGPTSERKRNAFQNGSDSVPAVNTRRLIAFPRKTYGESIQRKNKKACGNCGLSDRTGASQQHRIYYRTPHKFHENQDIPAVKCAIPSPVRITESFPHGACARIALCLTRCALLRKVCTGTGAFAQLVHSLSTPPCGNLTKCAPSNDLRSASSS